MTRFTTMLFLLAFTVVTVFNLYIFLPILHALVFAAILAGAFFPVQRRLEFKLKSKNAAAITTTGMVVFLIVIPVVYIMIQVSREAFSYYLEFQTGLQDGGLRNFFFGDGLIGRLLSKIVIALDLNLSNEELYAQFLQRAQGLSGALFQTINAWLSNTLNFLLSFVVMVMAIYGFLMEGAALKEFIFKLSPLPDEHEEQILSKFNQMNYAILVGNGVGGIIQGVLAGIALWFLGVPSVFLWTSLMVILAFIPLLGISIVTVPIALVTFLSGNQIGALLFIVYTTVLALGVENWFKPRFIGARVKMNSLLMLFYIIGGMGAFGVVGIFYGPIFATIFLTMSEIFIQSYLPKLQAR